MDLLRYQPCISSITPSIEAWAYRFQRNFILEWTMMYCKLLGVMFLLLITYRFYDSGYAMFITFHHGACYTSLQDFWKYLGNGLLSLDIPVDWEKENAVKLCTLKTLLNEFIYDNNWLCSIDNNKTHDEWHTTWLSIL